MYFLGSIYRPMKIRVLKEHDIVIIEQLVLLVPIGHRKAIIETTARYNQIHEMKCLTKIYKMLRCQKYTIVPSPRRNALIACHKIRRNRWHGLFKSSSSQCILKAFIRYIIRRPMFVNGRLGTPFCLYYILQTCFQL